jgi:N-acetylmuramoyl-L-alanine amidase
MGDTPELLRRGALRAGEKGAQLIVFVSVVAAVAIFLTSHPGSESASSAQIAFGPTRTPMGAPALATAEQTAAWTTAVETPTAESTPVVTPPTETPIPTPGVPRIGIVAGHWWLGEDGQQSLDVGAVCDEGLPTQLTELEINLDVAQRVVSELREKGYEADLLQEWDDRLLGYQADILLSVHADACLYPEASGFKVARVADSRVPDIEDRLVGCMIDAYGARTGLDFHQGSITADMAQYHTFYEIDPRTPGAIIEVGFMLTDRWLLTSRADLVAQGIIDGIFCFLEGEGRLLE